jgi:undecaprenyl-diphosphatase
MPLWQSILLGIIEGLTEFIPVSSTGHLLLIGHFLGFNSPGKTFEVLIQLGAILAVLTVYAAKIWQLLIDLPNEARARRFVFAVLLAFLPAAIIGALEHQFIKDVLFNAPMLVCFTLILGGIILLIVDRIDFKPNIHDVQDLPPMTALKIGFFQCLALVPGVSRSGSTIVGGLLLGLDKRIAAEFSFFLAMPTMAGAFAYDLYKNWHALPTDAVISISAGFIAAFISGVIVVKYVLGFITRHGFAPFAWWRIIVGTLGLVGLLASG